MAIPSGVNKICVIGKESVWGTAPAANTGKYMRRVTLDLNHTRESYESSEISSTAQTTDMRNGSDNIEGTLSAELSPGTYADLFASLLRGSWASGVTNTSMVVSAVAATPKFVRSAGDWISLGFKEGDLVIVSGFTTAANNGQFVVTSVTTTDLVVDGVLVDEAEGDSVTVAVDGKKLSIPLTPAGRTDESYTIEQYFNNISVSRVATGVKVTSASISIDPNANATVEFGLMGKNMTSTGSAYFTTPASASTTSVLSGSAGALYIGNTKVATVTSLSVEITGNNEAGTVIGERNPAAIFLGRIGVTGEFSAYFTDDTLYNQFINETDTSLVFRLNGDDGQTLLIKIPRLKIGGSSVDDKEVGGLIQSVPFTALLGDGTSTTTEQSTVVLQDTEAA